MLGKFFFGILGLLLLMALVFLLVRMLWLIHVSGRIQSATEPYEQNPLHPALSMLVLGDSTAIGTGARDNHETTAGRLGQDFPQAKIVNRGMNGKQTAMLVQDLAKEEGHFDLLLIQIGANDTLRFTNLGKLRVDTQALVEEAKKRSDRVVLLSSGDVGKAPFFPQFLRGPWSKRTVLVRDLFKAEAKRQNIVYVDLLAADVSDIFLTDIPRYHSPDLLHPTGDGYAIWYAEIKKSLIERGYWEELQTLSDH